MSSSFLVLFHGLLSVQLPVLSLFSIIFAARKTNIVEKQRKPAGAIPGTSYCHTKPPHTSRSS